MRTGTVASMNTMKRTVLLAVFLPLLACSERQHEQQAATIQPAAGPGSAEPSLAVTADGRALLSWLEPAEDGVALRYALLGAAGWSAPRTVAGGSDWFVNWADFPTVVPVTETLWSAHWLRRSGGSPYAYDVVMSLSPDAGQTWSPPFFPHDDGTPTEHGFVSLFPQAGGVGAIWLDGRNTLDDDPLQAAMTLRAAVFGANGARLEDHVIDQRVCDCCQTDVAVAASGPVAVYRDRSVREIRDIAVSRYVDGHWTEGVPVATDGWEIAGCPVNGPAIAARGEQVVVAWFTAADNDPRVKIAFSQDVASSFGSAYDVDAGQPLGRVGLALLPEGDALVTWLADRGDGSADIRAATYTANGRRREARVIATTGAGRLSGFPQVVIAGADVVFAWTDSAGGTTILRSRREPASAF